MRTPKNLQIVIIVAMTVLDVMIHGHSSVATTGRYLHARPMESSARSNSAVVSLNDRSRLPVSSALRRIGCARLMLSAWHADPSAFSRIVPQTGRSCQVRRFRRRPLSFFGPLARHRTEVPAPLAR